MGDFEVCIQVQAESTVEYHSIKVLILTLVCYESKKTTNNDEPEIIKKVCN